MQQAVITEATPLKEIFANKSTNKMQNF